MIIHTHNPSQFYCCCMKTSFLFVAVNAECSKTSHDLPQKTTLEQNGPDYELFLVRDWTLYFIWWFKPRISEGIITIIDLVLIHAQDQWEHLESWSSESSLFAVI